MMSNTTPYNGSKQKPIGTSEDVDRLFAGLKHNMDEVEREAEELRLAAIQLMKKQQEN